MSSRVHGKVLIFGGAGSLGFELVDHYRKIVNEIVVVSRDEGKHWDLKNKFGTLNQRGCYFDKDGCEQKLFCKIRTIVCDVRDARRVNQVIRSEASDFIIIAQALKQVDTCETQPSESIDTNIIGVRNIVDAIEEYSHLNAPKVCFVSTDKAVNPINVYGMSKSISERLVAATAKTSKASWVITRYGNVISSKGSIVPLFLKQAETAPAFTVTDPAMTRFMMLLSESVQLIDLALSYGENEELWIPNIDSFNVWDLAEYFKDKYNKPIKTIGIRPGEKIHEVLMTENEGRHWQKKHGQLVVSDKVDRAKTMTDYSSEHSVISKEELKRRMDMFLEKGTYDRKEV